MDKYSERVLKNRLSSVFLYSYTKRDKGDPLSVGPWCHVHILLRILL